MQNSVGALGLLRQINEEELDLMLSWRNSPRVRQNMYTQHEINRKEHLSWWARVCESDDKIYLIFERNNEPLGVVGFTEISPNNDANWAFYASPHAPRGTGSRMEYLALDFAFYKLHLRNLYCEVLSYNEPVRRLHTKFGFHTENIFSSCRQINNEFFDVYRLGTSVHKWESMRKSMYQRIINAGKEKS